MTSAQLSTPSGSWRPPSADEGLRLILVRHGATEATAQRRYSGRGDAPLSSQGKDQAHAAASRVRALVDTQIPTMVSSPLSRCVETAQTIASQTQATVDIEPELIECDFGEWDGLTFSDVSRVYSSQHAAWLGSPAVAPPGGESFREVGKRVLGFLDKLRLSYDTGVVVAVSHVSPIKLILQDALVASDAFLYRCYLSPAGISIVDYYPDGGVAVRTVNDTAHL